MVTILMLSAKLTAPDLLKIKVFGNKGDDVIISGHDVTNKFYYVIQIILQMWSFDQSLATLVFL